MIDIYAPHTQEHATVMLHAKKLSQDLKDQVNVTFVSVDEINIKYQITHIIKSGDYYAEVEYVKVTPMS